MILVSNCNKTDKLITTGNTRSHYILFKKKKFHIFPILTKRIIGKVQRFWNFAVRSKA